MLCCSPKKLDGIVTFAFASQDGFANVNKKSFRRTGVPDRYLDFGLVWKLDLHRVILGVHVILYRVGDRYVRNRRALHAPSLFALLVLQPF